MLCPHGGSGPSPECSSEIRGQEEGTQYLPSVERKDRMGKIRHLFKKIRDTSGTFHAKMGTINDRNDMDLTGHKILRRGGKSTELYQKDLHHPDNHNGVITHLEPDILECEVKWALGSVTHYKQS